MKNTSVRLCYWLMLAALYVTQCSYASSVEVTPEGTVKSNALEIAFENESGKAVELWSDDEHAVYFKRSMEDGDKVTLPADVGANYYFTNPDSGGSKEKVLYEFKISSRKTTVTLYDRSKMQNVLKTDGLGCDSTGCKIIFDNKTGKSLKVFWDDRKDGVFQGYLEPFNEMVQYTHVGHTFFFVLNKGGSTERLHTITIKKNMNLVPVK